jgi:hypothetical protein
MAAGGEWQNPLFSGGNTPHIGQLRDTLQKGETRTRTQPGHWNMIRLELPMVGLASDAEV